MKKAIANGQHKKNKKVLDISKCLWYNKYIRNKQIKLRKNEVSNYGKENDKKRNV